MLHWGWLQNKLPVIFFVIWLKSNFLTKADFQIYGFSMILFAYTLYM